LQNGAVITKQPLIRLLELPRDPNSEFNSLFKLSYNHLNVDNTEKMNVEYAAQTLSHSVAVALRRYLKDDAEAQELALFIDNINDWFDIMNSHHPNEKLDTKKPFAYTHNQIQKLDEVYKMIKNMLRTDRKSIQVFQKGILISIQSIKTLYCEMKRRYGVNYILTYKVNQDLLENFFSQIRGWGGTTHPSPLQCINRIKLIILG
jgi:hypothetical protein